jgi:type I restriction enzyme M protein
LGKNVVGVELNFNKEFYVPEKIEKVEDVMAEIASLNEKLKGIEL